MRLLIADKLHPRAIEELRTLPLEVVYEPELTKESLDKSLQGVGILVVRSTEVTANAIENAKQLNLIVRAGASFETIDVRAASKRGIYVANCPGKNAGAVAELVFGLLIALDRRVPDAVASLRAGKWERKEYGKAEGLHGKTLGIVGLGAIGREVAARARAFGLNLIAWSRSLTAARAAEMGIGYAPSLEELAAKSHILSLHLALVERTRGIVSRRVLALMPERATVINTARADLVDNEALLEAAQKRGFRVGLDVYPDEPRGGSRVFAAPEVFQNYPSGGVIYGTPHIAAATDQAQLAIASETVRDHPVVSPRGHGAQRRQRLLLLGGALPARHSDDGQGGHVCARSGCPEATRNQRRRGLEHGLRRGGRRMRESYGSSPGPTEACLAEIKAFDEVLHVDLVTLPMLA